jgi:hypothetical protein
MLVLFGESLNWEVYSAVLEDFDAVDSVDIVIVPDPSLARSTLDITEIWGEEIIIPDVPVKWFRP